MFENPILHVIFLVFLLGTEGFFLALDLLNLRFADRKIRERKQWLKDQFDIEDTDRLRNYMRLTTGFSRLKSIIGLSFMLLFLYSGLFRSFARLFSESSYDPLYEGMAFFTSLTVGMVVLSWPFSFFESFVVEEIFDFNNLTFDIWWKDQLKSVGLAIVFTALISGVLLWIINFFPATWWLWGWGFFVGFGLLMQIIYPRIIAPLFNEFHPVEEGDLREAVENVFDRAGFTCSQIFTMDASRRSGHSNAYFIGFGRTKRVVLFDTLINQLKLSEVQGVLAHELAHWQKGHVWKGVVRSAVRTGLMLGILYYLVESSWVYGMFGFSTGIPYVGLLLGGLWVGPLGQWLSPIVNRLSIRDEREADDYAVNVLGNGEPLAGALSSLVIENLGNPFPHPLYAAFHYSHPPIPDRIEYIRESNKNQTPTRNEPMDSADEEEMEKQGGS